MDHTLSREEEFELDLESGPTTSEEDDDESEDLVSIDGGLKKKILTRATGGHLNVDKSLTGVYGSKYGEGTSKKVELWVHESPEQSQEHSMAVLEKNDKDKRKRKASRKPPKPPRPPKGPTLDFADMKLVREMAELAMRKRARIERIKSLKRSRGARNPLSTSSTTSSLIITLFAMVITFLFALLMFSRANSRSNHGANFHPPAAKSEYLEDATRSSSFSF